MAWQTPIYDRTQLDVDYVKELSEKIYTQGFSALTAEEQNLWLNGLKGALNAIDLNRIEGNMEYIAYNLTQYAYPPNIDNFKTNWNVKDLSNTNSISMLNRIITNANKLIAAFYAQRTSIPTMLNNPTYEHINRIEKMLFEMKEMFQNMVADFRYSNTFNSAQVALPQGHNIDLSIYTAKRYSGTVYSGNTIPINQIGGE